MNFRKYSELDIGSLQLLGNKGHSKAKIRNNLHMLLGELQARMRIFYNIEFRYSISFIGLFFIGKPGLQVRDCCYKFFLCIVYFWGFLTGVDLINVLP